MLMYLPSETECTYINLDGSDVLLKGLVGVATFLKDVSYYQYHYQSNFQCVSLLSACESCVIESVCSSDYLSVVEFRFELIKRYANAIS